MSVPEQEPVPLYWRRLERTVEQGLAEIMARVDNRLQAVEAVNEDPAVFAQILADIEFKALEMAGRELRAEGRTLTSAAGSLAWQRFASLIADHVRVRMGMRAENAEVIDGAEG